MRFLIFLMCLCPLAAIAGSENTSYVPLKEVKVWPAYFDIYSEEDHVCDFQQRYRFKIPKDEKEMFSIALAAMASGMTVSINYDCQLNAAPLVTGLRVRRQ